MSEEVLWVWKPKSPLLCHLDLNASLQQSVSSSWPPTLQPLPHPTLQPLPHPGLVVPYVVLLIRSSLCLLTSILHSPLSLNHSGKTSRVVLCEIITNEHALNKNYICFLVCFKPHMYTIFHQNHSQDFKCSKEFKFIHLNTTTLSLSLSLSPTFLLLSAGCGCGPRWPGQVLQCRGGYISGMWWDHLLDLQNYSNISIHI